MMLGGYLSAVATSHRPAVGVDRGGRWSWMIEICDLLIALPSQLHKQKED